jgi:DNA repair exonuclease SbcCD ATPase subunit
MIKEISKKLTMKKTFFTTQLDGFFNSITQEYQDAIHQIEVEKRVLQEQVIKLEQDVKNLVQIKNEYEKTSNIDKRLISDYKDNIANTKQLSSSAYSQKLKKENELLRDELEKLKQNQSDPKELEELQDKVKKLQGYLAKGVSAYNDNIITQKNEQLIKDINESLKK